MNQPFAHYLGKFGIGAFAGICACVGPVVGYMPIEEGGIIQKLLSVNFITVTIITVVIVGAATVIIFANSELELGQIFMRALGFPALLLGGINVGFTANNASILANDVDELIPSAAKSSGVEYYGGLEALPPDQVTVSRRVRSNESQFPFTLISPAHAGSPSYHAGGQFLAQKIGENYVVVLGVASDETAVKQLEDKWRTVVPTAIQMRHGTGYFIIDRRDQRFASEALREAERIKAEAQRQGLSPNQVGIMRLSP